MDTQNGQTPTEPIDEQPDQIQDKDELSHLRRQQKIEETREQALDIRTEAYGRMINGQMSRQQACRQYRGVVETLLIQVVPLIERHAPNSEYLHDVPIGELEFEPPEELQEFASDNVVRLVDGCRVPTPETVPIRGLKTVLTANSPLQASWKVTVKGKGRPEERTATVQRELTFQMLDNVVQQADSAMDELGFGMKTDDSETYKIE